mmetsp:Transcript_16727/g.47851  ORF Transcript_16727/g.47851 Transcript_16727/m.47851 type:complete len:364 (-) Transcript_16727:33-1124(-)
MASGFFAALSRAPAEAGSTAAIASAPSAAPAPSAGMPEDGDPLRGAFRSLRRLLPNTVAGETAEQLSTPLASDLEAGQEPQWANWARAAVGRVRDQATIAAEQAQQGFQQVAERAQTVDWNEQVQGVKGSLSRNLENMSAMTTATASTFQERVAHGVESARSGEWTDQAKGFQKNLSQSFDSVVSTASSAGSSFQESATSAAGASRRVLTAAGGRVTGAAQLAMDPVKLARFFGVFLVGVFLIMISLNFLPALLLKPANFAFFFTLGSITMMSSFVVLNGASALATALMQRSKLPFTAAYVVGLLGTLVATLFLRSYLITAIFALMQAVSLLYLVASYLPGGTSFLNMVGRFGSRSARSVVLG